MIERQHGHILIECDLCGQVFEGESGEWNEVWPLAKAEGWQAKKVDESIWMHNCPDCAGRP